jgi:hypothetical protein
MIMDVMERLFERTGDTRYLDFSVWFYDEWSRNVTADTTISSLLNRSAPFSQHGVHVYETIRVPLWLASATGRGDLSQASRNAMEKLSHYIEPGGSAVSQEMISKLAPDPTFRKPELRLMQIWPRKCGSMPRRVHVLRTAEPLLI